MAQDTAHASQDAERTHRCTGAKWLRTPYMQHNTPSVHTDEQEPGGRGHRTHSTTHRVYTLLNSSKVAGETTHATQHAERPQRSTRAMWPRCPQTQHNTRIVHTGGQKPSGPGHRKRNTTRRAHTPVITSQAVHDTAHTAQHTE